MTTAEKWPDDKLEATIIADAERSFDPDVPCHIKALLARVRELETETRRLKHDLELIERKISHGCTDANCKECERARRATAKEIADEIRARGSA